MAHYQPGITYSPSPQALEIVRERLHRAGFPITEPAARSLLEAVLAVEAPRMEAISRGILHGSLETIRQTAEVALSALRESGSGRDLVGVVKQHLRVEDGEGDNDLEDDARPVFKRPRGR